MALGRLFLCVQYIPLLYLTIVLDRRDSLADHQGLVYDSLAMTMTQEKSLNVRVRCLFVELCTV